MALGWVLSKSLRINPQNVSRKKAEAKLTTQ